MEPRRLRPLNGPALERIALRYVERYATTRAKLARYLARKVRERGWEDDAPADPAALAQRMADLRYVDDRGFAEAKADAMMRRGFGSRRITGALYQAGVEEADAVALAPAIQASARDSALAYARRRRIGPFATVPPDRAARDKAVAAMLRAGHGLELAREIVALAPGEQPEGDDAGSTQA